MFKGIKLILIGTFPAANLCGNGLIIAIYINGTEADLQKCY